jgi:phosphoglycolate phosphatase-like HAD superfamily hydrolase
VVLTDRDHNTRETHQSGRRPTNIFFDVDHTIIDSDNRLRPGVRELFERLRADGHRVFLWSGIGARWEIVERYALGELVSGCFEKPLYQYERMLGPLGIVDRPDFVVDDHPHLVHAFGGCVVARYLTADAGDTEMERVYREIERAAARRRPRSSSD